jgi:tetratricopeptide (TPR) repeat protein
LNEALAQNPNAGWLYAWRGAVKLSLDRPAEGESDLSLATRVAPDFAWAWGWRGRLRWQTGRPQEAEADLNEALRLDPRTTWLWTWRSELRAGQGRGEEALADAETARALAPETAESWYARGEALRALKRAAEAKESYDRALFFDPRHRFAHIGRGLAKGELGDVQGQIDDFRKVAQLAPDLFRKTVEALQGLEGAQDMEEFIRAIMTPDPEPPKGGLKEMAATGDIPS